MGAPKQLQGPVQERPDETPKEHQWDTGWLNHSPGEATCKVCGARRVTTLIRADRQMPNGKQLYHYEDCHGNRISTFEELSCPIYIGDPGSAAATAKEGVRKVKHRVSGVETRVDTVEARLARLEAENEILREQIARGPLIDAITLIEGLRELAKGIKESPQGAALLEDNRVVIDIGEFQIREREIVLVEERETSEE